MTATVQIRHPYAPAHMTRTSIGNVAACCDKPEADHEPFIDGTTTRVILTHAVRSINGQTYPKGTVLTAERSYRKDTLQEVRPSRWFKNERGNMEEERGEYEMVATPGWTLRLGNDSHRTGISWKWAKEVS